MVKNSPAIDTRKSGRAGNWYRRLACRMAYGCTPEELERLREIREREEQQRKQAEDEARERRIRQRQYQAPVIHFEISPALAQPGQGAVIQVEIEDVIEHRADDGHTERQQTIKQGSHRTITARLKVLGIHADEPATATPTFQGER